MDWGAIGAVATAAAVVVAYFQLRATKKSNSEVPRLADGSAQSRTTPKLFYRKLSGTGSISIPERLTIDIMDSRWADLENFRSDLSRLEFTLITIENRNEFAIGRIALELSCRNPYSAKIEEAKKLSRNAAIIKAFSDRVTLTIDEMPAGERMIFSVLAQSIYGLASLNASVDLKNQEYLHV